MRVGTDIVEVSRIKRAVERTGQAFLDRVYTPGEQEYCLAGGRVRYESLAARFAAKEAYSKAVGTGVGEHAQLQEIEVKHTDTGKPVLVLSGSTLKFFESNFPGAELDISLSHTRSLAAATVVIGHACASNSTEEIPG